MRRQKGGLPWCEPPRVDLGLSRRQPGARLAYTLGWLKGSALCLSTGGGKGTRCYRSPAPAPLTPLASPHLHTAALLAISGAVNAIEIPSQASTGSTVRRGSLPTSTSGAS